MATIDKKIIKKFKAIISKNNDAIHHLNRIKTNPLSEFALKFLLTILICLLVVLLMFFLFPLKTIEMLELVFTIDFDRSDRNIMYTNILVARKYYLSVIIIMLASFFYINILLRKQKIIRKVLFKLIASNKDGIYIYNELLKIEGDVKKSNFEKDTKQKSFEFQNTIIDEYKKYSVSYIKRKIAMNIDLEQRNIKSVPVVGLRCKYPNTELFSKAIEYGYSFFDISQDTEIGGALGNIIHKGVKKRNTFFISSVIECTNVNDAYSSLQKTIENLGANEFNYLDLLLVDSKGKEIDIGFWQTLESLKTQKIIRFIGGVDFHTSDIETLIAAQCSLPVINKIEVHPYYQRKEFIDFCNRKNIRTLATAPLGLGENDVIPKDMQLLQDIIIKAIAEYHDVTPAQVVLRWHFQQNRLSIPSTTSTEHLLENSKLFHFSLSNKEMQRIENLDKNISLVKEYMG